MNKPITIKCADIYLRFPEIMEDEMNDLADFLEDEHIVYEGATDVFMEKDKEIERLNNIINELEKLLDEMIIETKKTTTVLWKSEKIGIRRAIEHIKYKLKELRESVNNEG